MSDCDGRCFDPSGHRCVEGRICDKRAQSRLCGGQCVGAAQKCVQGRVCADGARDRLCGGDCWSGSQKCLEGVLCGARAADRLCGRLCRYPPDVCRDGKICPEGSTGTCNGECFDGSTHNCVDGHLCRAPANAWQRCAGCYQRAADGLGARCFHDGECASGRCSGAGAPLCAAGICVCDDDDDCRGGYCDTGTLTVGTNGCQDLKGDHASCVRPMQCQSRHCGMTRCYTPNSKGIGETCFMGAECRIGKCNNVVDGTKGTCVCKTDADCGKGQWCDAGLDLKKNACKQKLSKGEVCGVPGELGVGHRCKSGKCKWATATQLKCK